MKHPMKFELEEFLPYRLHQAAEATSQQFLQKYKDKYSLNRTEFRAMINIGSYGPISATDISRRSQLDKGILSRAVLRLENEGWIKRQYRENDRRGHDLVLTKAGKPVFEDLQKLALEYSDYLDSQLTSRESTQLIKLLKKLNSLKDLR